jgi:hypothetical protein
MVPLSASQYGGGVSTFGDIKTTRKEYNEVFGTAQQFSPANLELQRQPGFHQLADRIIHHHTSDSRGPAGNDLF